MMTRSMRPKLGFVLALVLSLQSLAEAAELTAYWPVGPGGGMVDAVAGIHQLLPGKLAQMVVREPCGSATVTYAKLDGVQYRVASWRLYDKSDSGARMPVASGAHGNRIAFSVPEQAARLQLEVELEKKSGFAVILR